MKPAYWEKQPWEDRLLALNLSEAVAAGDSLSGSATVTVYDTSGTDVSSTMTTAPPTVTGNTVYFRIKGGTHGHRYWAEVRGTTTVNSDKIEEDLLIIVSDKRLET
jgi:hypothetical protein